MPVENVIKGYKFLHSRLRVECPHNNICNHCKKETSNLDLANISQLYLDSLDDWEYLCRRCHMQKDGRMNNLNKGVMEKTYCKCGQPAVVHNGVCMKKYNCLRRHKQPCTKACQ